MLKDKKLNFLEKKNTVFSTQMLEKRLGSRMAIKRLVENNFIICHGAGFYSTPDLDPSVALVHIVARFFTDGIVSGISALVVHSLSDEVLQKVTIDIPKEKRVRNSIIDARRITKDRMIGIAKKKYHGRLIRVYDVERSLCDAFRVDKGSIFFKALKRYLKLYTPQLEKISAYDSVLGTKVMRAIQQELADD